MSSGITLATNPSIVSCLPILGRDTQDKLVSQTRKQEMRQLERARKRGMKKEKNNQIKGLIWRELRSMKYITT